MTIRLAIQSDARAITEVLQSLKEYPRYRQDALDVLEKKILTNLRTAFGRTVFVALLESRVIGFIVVHWFVPLTAPLEGFVSNLFVHAEFSNFGAGTALLEAVNVEARAKGCSRLALNNWRDKISFQRGFYAKHGFVEKPLSARFVLQFEGSV